MLSYSYSKRKEPVTSEAKQNQTLAVYIKSCRSTSGTWDLRSFRFQRAWMGSSTSPAAPSASPGLRLVPYHTFTILSDGPTVFASPVDWSLHCNSGCTFTTGLLASLQGLQPYPMVPNPTFLHDSFNPGTSIATEASSSPVTCPDLPKY